MFYTELKLLLMKKKKNNRKQINNYDLENKMNYGTNSTRTITMGREFCCF